MKELIRKSKITGKEYNLYKCVAVKNIRQAGEYCLHDVYPVDIEFIRSDVGLPQLIFYFDKAESAEVFDLWCNYKLK